MLSQIGKLAKMYNMLPCTQVFCSFIVAVFAYCRNQDKMISIKAKLLHSFGIFPRTSRSCHGVRCFEISFSLGCPTYPAVVPFTPKRIQGISNGLVLSRTLTQSKIVLSVVVSSTWHKYFGLGRPGVVPRPSYKSEQAHWCFQNDTGCNLLGQGCYSCSHTVSP